MSEFSLSVGIIGIVTHLLLFFVPGLIAIIPISVIYIVVLSLSISLNCTAEKSGLKLAATIVNMVPLAVSLIIFFFTSILTGDYKTNPIPLIVVVGSISIMLISLIASANSKNQHSTNVFTRNGIEDAEELRTWKKLLDDKVITDEMFETKRKEILNRRH